MKPSLAAAKALIKYKDKFLVLLQEYDGITYISLPGGKIRSGESPQEALIREVKEETGLSIDIKEHVGIWWFSDKNNQQVICNTFLCTATNKEITTSQIEENENITKHLWVHKEEINTIQASKSKSLEAFFSSLQNKKT